MKDIKGYEGLYAVTSCGKVWSYRSKKFMKPYDNGFGYLYVSLCKDGRNRQIKLHRLVAEAYLTPEEGKNEVDHIDRNRYNNCVNNLRYVSSQENKANAEFLGKHKCFSKVRCVETGEIFADCVEAAKAVGVHRYAINCVLLGKQKTSAGYHWERVLKNEEEISQSK